MSKVDKWKKLMDEYYFTASDEKLIEDSKKAGIILSKIVKEVWIVTVTNHKRETWIVDVFDSLEKAIEAKEYGVNHHIGGLYHIEKHTIK